MTAKTTKPRPLPWGRYSDAVAAQIEAGIAREQSRGPRTVNGAPTYRDGGTRESYTVGYGGERTYSRPVPDPNVLEATEPMKKLIDNLLVEREHITLTDDVIADIKKNKAQSHRLIKFLINQPRVQAPIAPVERTPEPEPVAPTRARLDFKAIPDGNYAVREDGVIKFYRVSTGKSGYKNVQVRASDDLHMLFGRAGIAVLHRIVEAGLAESAMLFATELGRCWRCGKSLTDEESRARGMGPDCASK